jgi:hypothetical protein
MGIINLLSLVRIDEEGPRPLAGRATIVAQQEFTVLEADFFARAVDLYPDAVDANDAWILRAALARARR